MTYLYLYGPTDFGLLDAGEPSIHPGAWNVFIRLEMRSHVAMSRPPAIQWLPIWMRTGWVGVPDLLLAEEARGVERSEQSGR